MKWLWIGLLVALTACDGAVEGDGKPILAVQVSTWTVERSLSGRCYDVLWSGYGYTHGVGAIGSEVACP